jgi:putative ABC transport system ATP-binding protein
MNNHGRDPFLFRTEHLSKLYPDGQVHAVEDVTISVRRGEYVAIMGPSGSGKSTLLNLLGALDKPTSGEVYFDGQPLSTFQRLDRLRVEKFGFVFQSFHLLPILTSLENVQVPMFEGRLSAPARARKAKELLELVGMNHRGNHLPQKLSVGERQRVAIARSLANDPIALLADEPTGNLDSVSAEGIFDLFAYLHREQGMTIVLITHDEEFGQRAQRTIRMQDGHVKSDVFCERRRIRTPMPPFAV